MEQAELHEDVQETVEVVDDIACQATCEALKGAKDLHARALAEFDNYRKRTAQQLRIGFEDGAAHTITKLLPVFDNFERALASAPSESPITAGMNLIVRQIHEFMEDTGLSEIAVAQGDAFDPKLHNAVAHTTDDSLGENTISQVLQKGYKLGTRVIRHTVVQTAN